MAYTVQEVLDKARLPLNDASKVTYPDLELLKHYNAAMFRLYEVRPDLQFGGFGTPFTPLATVTGNMVVPDRFAQPLADYIGGRAELKDSELVTNGRAQALMKLFVDEVTA